MKSVACVQNTHIFYFPFFGEKSRKGHLISLLTSYTADKMFQSDFIPIIALISLCIYGIFQSCIHFYHSQISETALHITEWRAAKFFIKEEMEGVHLTYFEQIALADSQISYWF